VIPVSAKTEAVEDEEAENGAGQKTPRGRTTRARGISIITGEHQDARM